jgi:hypothetical protein
MAADSPVDRGWPRSIPTKYARGQRVVFVNCDTLARGMHHKRQREGIPALAGVENVLLPGWPSEDHRTRMVFITRKVPAI